MLSFLNQKLSQYLFDWKRKHSNPSSMSLLSLKEITRICNKPPGISFLGIWARCCKLVTDNSLHFTQCELLFFFTRHVTIWKASIGPVSMSICSDNFNTPISRLGAATPGFECFPQRKHQPLCGNGSCLSDV